MLETIILRFRDLVTDRGQTVVRHNEVTAREGYVWWGWWHKRDETVPDDAFREILVRAQAGGAEIYLMDSGHALLYRTQCTDIKWDIGHLEIPSPDTEKTPEYYNQKKYLAWFRIREISLVDNPDDALHRYSYFKVNQFFEQGESNYTVFYGKQVYSINELRQQDRTVWFLRLFQPGDPTNEISLLKYRQTAPTHFSKEIFESPSRTMLWLSDTHFSEQGHHAFPLKPEPAAENLAGALKRDFGKAHPVVAGVIISGDITWKALRREFELAEEFIRQLTFWFPLDSDHLAICPGNHDLKFSTDPADKNTRITITDDTSRAEYSQFYQDVFYLGPNEFLSCGKRLLLGKAVPVEIVCLNSSSLQQIQGAFQGHGFIGQKQMDDAADQMGWDTESSAPHAYRIVVLHHHILPTTYVATPEANYPYSVVLDAEALSRWLVKHRVSLVLHGHMHQPFCAKVSRPFDVNKPQDDWHDFFVLGMGSSGVTDDVGEVGKNTVGFLQFEKDHINISVHSIHPTNPSALIWQLDVPLEIE
jgi:hypothetical protein